MPYPGEVNGNNNLGGNVNPNDSKEHRSAHGKGGQEGSRFGQGDYNPNENNWLLIDE